VWEKNGGNTAALDAMNQPAKAPPRALKVLVAEDNIINQRIAVEMLHALGHTGVVVGDGVIALKCLAKLTFDVVLMDVMMPHMDGLAALAAIRAKEQTQGAHLPIIMVTAHTEPGEAARFRRAGADGYVPKPLDQDVLKAELHRLFPY
jgi:two-component system, sensor histidine kinase and response regulator